MTWGRLPAWRLVVCCGLASALCGCPQTGTGPQEPPFIPMRQVIHEFNAGARAMSFTLRARWINARGLYVDEIGHDETFDLTGSIIFRKPRDLRMQLNHVLRPDVFQLGSNETEYWVAVRDKGQYWWGTYDAEGRPRAGSMPFRPDHITEVLAVHELPEQTRGPNGPIYRVENDRNVLEFLAYSPDGQAYITKEYHFDRFNPALVREMKFRDETGRVQMHAALSDHAEIQDTGVIVPRRISIRSPTTGSHLDLQITDVDRLDRALPNNYFRSPRQRGERFEHERCVDELTAAALAPPGDATARERSERCVHEPTAAASAPGEPSDEP